MTQNILTAFLLGAAVDALIRGCSSIMLLEVLADHHPGDLGRRCEAFLTNPRAVFLSVRSRFAERAVWECLGVPCHTTLRRLDF